MRILLLLVAALADVACFNDSLRRTMLPNGYSLDTMGRKFGIIVRPDSPRSGNFKPVWPPLNGEQERCGAFGWRDTWVVCEVVTYEHTISSKTGRFAVLNTATGVVTLVDDRGSLTEMMRQASVEVPALAEDHPSTMAIYFPE